MPFPQTPFPNSLWGRDLPVTTLSASEIQDSLIATLGVFTPVSLSFHVHILLLSL